MCITFKKTMIVVLLFFLTTPTFSSPNNGNIDVQNSLTINQEDLQNRRLNAEIEKLQKEKDKLEEEKRKLQIENQSIGPVTKRISTILGALGGLFGAMVGLLIWILGRSVTENLNKAQNAKLDQDKVLGREAHNLELFRDLADQNPGIRLAAASILIQRLNEFREQKKEDKKNNHINKLDELEHRTIIQTLLGVTKEGDGTSGAQTSLCKLIADNLALDAGALLKEGKKPSKDKLSPLATLDFQKARLNGAWWKRIDAREVDFFEADLSNAGLTDGFLSKAIFYKAKLNGTVFKNADLREANFFKAELKNANLSGADLRGANLCDSNLRQAVLEGANLIGAKFNSATKWPHGFNPIDAQAIEVA